MYTREDVFGFEGSTALMVVPRDFGQVVDSSVLRPWRFSWRVHCLRSSSRLERCSVFKLSHCSSIMHIDHRCGYKNSIGTDVWYAEFSCHYPDPSTRNGQILSHHLQTQPEYSIPNLCNQNTQISPIQRTKQQRDPNDRVQQIKPPQMSE